MKPFQLPEQAVRPVISVSAQKSFFTDRNQSLQSLPCMADLRPLFAPYAAILKVVFQAFGGDIEPLFLAFAADKAAAFGQCGQSRAARAHKGVEYRIAAIGVDGDDFLHERKGFLRGVGGAFASEQRRGLEKGAAVGQFVGFVEYPFALFSLYRPYGKLHVLNVAAADVARHGVGFLPYQHILYRAAQALDFVANVGNEPVRAKDDERTVFVQQRKGRIQPRGGVETPIPIAEIYAFARVVHGVELVFGGNGVGRVGNDVIDADALFGQLGHFVQAVGVVEAAGGVCGVLCGHGGESSDGAVGV